MMNKGKNADHQVIRDFGSEWKRFSYEKTSIDQNCIEKNFWQYFSIFPFDRLPKDAAGFDMGCGTGRWAQFVAPRVGKLICIEPSDAIDVAKKNLERFPNVVLRKETSSDCSLRPESMDFGYCLGVVHHMPDPGGGIRDCSRLLKQGGYLLLYIYYNFENRSWLFRTVWKVSDAVRKCISRLPLVLKKLICDAIAAIVYWPIAKLAAFFEKWGVDSSRWLLSDYRDKPFYQMRNDSLDRFGTRLEHRFSQEEIQQMLTRSDLELVAFSEEMPFWCCLAQKK